MKLLYYSKRVIFYKKSMKKIILFLASCLLLQSCFDASLKSEVESEGLSEIVIRYDYSGSEDDSVDGSSCTDADYDQVNYLINPTCRDISEGIYEISGDFDYVEAGILVENANSYQFDISEALSVLSWFNYASELEFEDAYTTLEEYDVNVDFEFILPGTIQSADIGEISGRTLEVNFMDQINYEGYTAISSIATEVAQQEIISLDEETLEEGDDDISLLFAGLLDESDVSEDAYYRGLTTKKYILSRNTLNRFKSVKYTKAVDKLIAELPVATLEKAQANLEENTSTHPLVVFLKAAVDYYLLP